MKQRFTQIFQLTPDEQFSYTEPSEELQDNDYLELKKRDTVKCRDCSKDAKIVPIGDEKKVICPNHKNSYQHDDKYWKADTEQAIKDYLEKHDIEFDSIEKESDSYSIRINSSVILLATGEFSKGKERDYIQALKSGEYPCVVCFTKETQEKFSVLTNETVSLSMAVRPPRIPRKVARFISLVDMRDEMTAELMPENNIPDGMLEEVTKNPLNVVERLTHFEKVEKDKSKWNDLEPLSVIALSQIYDLPLKTLGAKETGKRVPDGLGILKDEDGRHTHLLLTDAKSVSSVRRDYPKLTGDDAFQYKHYIEDAEETCWNENMDGKFLIFVSPEFKQDKAIEFLEELEETSHSDFNVAFLTLEGLSILLMIFSDYISERKVRTAKNGRVAISRKLLLEPQFDKEQIDYELGEYDSVLLDGGRVYEHLNNVLEDMPDKEGKMEELRQKVES